MRLEEDIMQDPISSPRFIKLRNAFETSYPELQRKQTNDCTYKQSFSRFDSLIRTRHLFWRPFI